MFIEIKKNYEVSRIFDIIFCILSVTYNFTSQTIYKYNFNKIIGAFSPFDAIMEFKNIDESINDDEFKLNIENVHLEHNITHYFNDYYSHNNQNSSDEEKDELKL